MTKIMKQQQKQDLKHFTNELVGQQKDIERKIIEIKCEREKFFQKKKD